MIRNRPKPTRAVYGEYGIILTITVRDKREGPIQTALQKNRIMGPYHFIDVSIQGPDTPEFTTLRWTIRGILNKEIGKYEQARASH